MVVRVLLVVLTFASPALAAEIYLSTGSSGEASFSDIALPDAVTVPVEVHQPSVEETDSTRERLAETLAIGWELEDARREREKVYAERRAAANRRAAQQIPKSQEPEDYRVVSSGYFGDYFPYPRPPHHRPHTPRKPRMSPGHSKRWGRSPDS